jgi:hypothetical protein
MALLGAVLGAGGLACRSNAVETQCVVGQPCTIPGFDRSGYTCAGTPASDGVSRTCACACIPDLAGDAAAEGPDAFVPTPIDVPVDDAGVVLSALSISPGLFFTCLRGATGQTWQKGKVSCWGYDEYGQLGNELELELDEVDASPVVGLPGSLALSVGGYNACVIAPGPATRRRLVRRRGPVGGRRVDVRAEERRHRVVLGRQRPRGARARHDGREPGRAVAGSRSERRRRDLGGRRVCVRGPLDADGRVLGRQRGGHPRRRHHDVVFGASPRRACATLYAPAAIASASRGNCGLNPRSSRMRRPSRGVSNARARSASEPSGGGAPTDANSVARSGAWSSTTL